MLKIIFLILLIPCLCVGAGLQDSFSGSTDLCGSDPELLFCYMGEVNQGGELIDFSGENLLTDRTEFDDWTETGTCNVTADQWRSPVSGAMTADLLDSTSGLNTSNRNLTTAALGTLGGRTFTLSVWVRSDYNHVISIRMTETAGGTNSIEHIGATSVWQRVSFSWTIGASVGAGAITVSVYPGQQAVSTGIAYFSDTHLTENDRYRTNMGNYLNPADQSVTKPDHDLASTNSPTRDLSDAEYRGQRLKARRLNGTNQYYSKSHHDSMNINDSDHTYTFFVSSDTDAADADVIYSHGSPAINGMFVYADSTANVFGAFYFRGGGLVDVTSQSMTTNDGAYHIVQVVRRSNTATVYVDGIPGTPVDVDGEGIDGSQTLYLGRAAAGAYWKGRISYSKATARALSEDELAAEREKIWSVYGGKGSALASWTIARSTVAHKTFAAGGAHAINNAMAEVAANIPRASRGLLVEGPATNEVDYSEQFNLWSQTRTSTANTTDLLSPKGTQTVDKISDTVSADLQHYVYLANIIPVTSGDDFCFSLYVAAGSLDWVAIRLYDASGIDLNGTFNVATGMAGTMSGDVDNYGIEPAGWPFYRIWISGEMDATVASLDLIAIYLAEGNADWQFVGTAGNNYLYAWGAQIEEGTFPTSYIEVPSTANITRTADDVTMYPVRFTGLPLTGDEMMWIDFSQDPSGATITTSDGGYTLTKNGQPEHHRTEVFGDYHYLNGSSHWSRADDGSFDPSGDFSVVCGVIPADVTGSEVLMAKYNSAFSADRGWLLYQSNNDLLFFVYSAGGSSNDSLANGFVAGKPTLVGASYDYVTDGTSVITVFQNDLTPQSMATAVGPVRDVGSDFTIGATDDSALDFTGEFLFCSYIDGRAIVQADFESMYESFIQDYVLPKQFGGNGEADKVTVRVDLKCQYSGSANIGGTRDLLEIGGNYQTATWTRNRLLLEATQAGRIYFWFSDDADADHYALTAPDPLDFSEWFGLWFVVDFDDLSRMDGWYRQGLTGDWTRVTSWNGNSGSAEFNLVDTMIQIGADPSGTVEANCEFQNLDIRAEEIRP